MLLTLKTKKEILNWSNQFKGNIGFVPTMGALHAGHVSLFTQAAKVCSTTVASIFVNPLQFNNALDLAKYPKTLTADLVLLKKGNINTLFLPEANAFYEGENTTHLDIDIGPLDNVYEGLLRPGHFNGVVKVLTLLFELIQPTHVFFGQKDLQQCLVVEKLIAQKFNTITLHTLPTLREENGLAMSSRNERLSKEDRENAGVIYTELQRLKANKNWNVELPSSLISLQKKGFEVEYLDLIDLPNMQKTTVFNTHKQAILFAGWLNGVRLIDNVLV